MRRDAGGDAARDVEGDAARDVEGVASTGAGEEDGGRSVAARDGGLFYIKP